MNDGRAVRFSRRAEKAKTDKEALYQPEVLRALEWLKTNRPGEWESRKEDIKALKVSLQLLQRAMKAQTADLQPNSSEIGRAHV